MNKISRSSILLLTASALSFLPAGKLAAQTKVAYIDAGKLIKRMPEATDATSRLDQLTASWTKEADDIQNDLTRKQAEYDRRKLIMTDAERSSAEVELQNLRKRLDDFRQSKFGANGELFVQEAQLMKPAYDRLMKATDEAAHEGGFDYVFDRSSRDVVMLYSNSKYDLTVPVARKLGIESDILTAPLINNGPKTPGTPGAPGANPGAPTTTPNGTSLGNPNGAAQNQGTNPQPGVNSQPSFNSGSYNPDQTPRPPTKEPATTTPH